MPRGLDTLTFTLSLFLWPGSCVNVLSAASASLILLMQPQSSVDKTDALCSIYCPLCEPEGPGNEVQGKACKDGDSLLESAE